MSETTEQIPAAESATAAQWRYTLISQAIEELRPHLRADGGDCELVAVDGNLITVRLHGACIGCQLSSVTLAGVQQKLIEKLGMPLRIALAKPAAPKPISLAPQPELAS